MAKYGSADLKIEFDNAGGTLVDMSAYVLSINDYSVESITEDATTFGVAWNASLNTGVKMLGDLDVEFFYDDTATSGPDVIFNAPGNTTTRTLKITWGGTKTSSVETIIAKYVRIAKVKALTRAKVTLRPTGAVTEV